MDISVTKEIDAPLEQVWRILSDVEHWPEWTPTMTKVTLLAGGLFAVGSRAEVVQPQLPTMTYEITEIEENRSFTWVGRSLGVRVEGSHVVETMTPSRTRVRLGVGFSGPLRRPALAMSRKRTQRYVQTEAEELARAATGLNPA